MNVAVIGTGLLGHAVAQRILTFDHSLTCFNRTADKAADLKDLGARIASTPKEAIASSEYILLLLSDAAAITDILDQCDEGLSNKTILQMGTIAPSESIAFQKKIVELNGTYVECPVLGSRKEALSGTLIVMVGADEAQYKECLPIFEMFGSNPRLVGEVGKAAALKLALNQLIASHAVSFSVSLGIVQKNNIDLNHFSDILRESALYAPMFDKKVKNWTQQNYENPNFPVKHLQKDVDLVRKECAEKGISDEVLKAIDGLLEKSIQQGLADQDYSAVFNTINNI